MTGSSGSVGGDGVWRLLVIFPILHSIYFDVLIFNCSVNLLVLDKLGIALEIAGEVLLSFIEVCIRRKAPFKIFVTFLLNNRTVVYLGPSQNQRSNEVALAIACLSKLLCYVDSDVCLFRQCFVFVTFDAFGV